MGANQWSIVVLLVAMLSAACGGGDSAKEPSDAQPPLDMSMGSHDASRDSGARGGDANGGLPSDGALPNADCSGAFGPAEMLFTDVGQSLNSLSPTADELELFYVQQDAAGNPSRVVARKRASARDAFLAPSEVTEVAGICGTSRPTIDLSEDGLRLYIVCGAMRGDPMFGLPGPLYLATRPSRASAFTLATGTIGTVATSIGLARGELVAYAAPLDTMGKPLVYARSAIGQPFGGGNGIGGLDGPFYTPEPTGDSLQLLGAAFLGVQTRIVVASRATVSDPFSQPSTDGMPVPPTGATDGSPAISADCRTLYWVRFVVIDGGTMYSVQWAHR